MSNSVKVPVSADASRAISEMERFTSAIRKTGQEGRKFAELDFSHPEMKGFADHMIEAQRRFEEMVKAGRGKTANELRSGVGAGQYQDITSWWSGTPKQFPQSEDRDRHITRVTNGLFHGTPVQPAIRLPDKDGGARDQGPASTATDPRKPDAKTSGQIELFPVKPEQAKVEPQQGSVIDQAGAGAKMRWELPAMDRFTSALRKAGQEGRKFAEIDFSHPEMAELKDEMIDAQRRFEEMVRSGRSEAARELRSGVRSGRYGDMLEWRRNVAGQFPNAMLRDRHAAGVMGSLFPAQAPQQPPKEGKPGGFGLPGLGGGVGSLLRWALPIVGLAKIGSMAAQGLGDATEEAIEISALRRSMGAVATDFESFRSDLRKSGEGLGVTYQETVKLARAFTQASGQVEERAAFGGTRDAVGFARALGMDPSQAVGRFGRAQWLQAGGKTADTKELAYLFADAIAAGGMFAKGDEVMDAITNWVASSERVMVDAPNTRDFAAMQAAMNASNRPGMQGAAGAAVLNQVDGAIRGGGGAGEAGQNFLYRIMAGAGVRDPFEMKYELEEGAFNKLDDGRTIIQAVQEALQQQYANPMMRASAGARLLNLSMHQYQALEKIEPADLDSIGAAGKRHGFDPTKLDTGTYMDLAMLGRKDKGELQQYRNHLLRNRNGELTEPQREALATNDEGELRDALIKTVAAIGMEKDLGRQTQEATVDIKNNIAKLAGNGLGLLTDIKELIRDGLGLTNDAVDYLGRNHQANNPIIDQYNESNRFKGSLAAGKGKTAASAEEIGYLTKTFPGNHGAMASIAKEQEFAVKVEPVEVIHKDAARTPFMWSTTQASVLKRPSRTR